MTSLNRNFYICTCSRPSESSPSECVSSCLVWQLLINLPRAHTAKVSPVMDSTVCFGALTRSSVAFYFAWRWRSAATFSRSFACDSLNDFTMVAYPCRCVMGSQVSSFLSYPSNELCKEYSTPGQSMTWLWTQHRFLSLEHATGVELFFVLRPTVTNVRTSARHCHRPLRPSSVA